MKLVIRLLDCDGKLLGWTEHAPLLLGDGTLRAAGPVVIPVEEAGVTAFVSTHWCDVNVETRVHAGTLTVAPGFQYACFRYKDVIVRVGEAATGLPPVTVKSHTVISVPVGSMVSG
jgi:hypothetical protein